VPPVTRIGKVVAPPRLVFVFSMTDHDPEP
jgi:hypothetical protein